MCLSTDHKAGKKSKEGDTSGILTPLPLHIQLRKRTGEKWDPLKRGRFDQTATRFPDPLIRKEDGEQEEPDYDYLEGVICYNCFAEGHLAKHCQNPTVDTNFPENKRCYECGSTSHKGWECPTQLIFCTKCGIIGECERCPAEVERCGVCFGRGHSNGACMRGRR